MNNPLEGVLAAIGAIAEMSLQFYRALLSAGASTQEAAVLTQAYLAATIYGNRKEGTDEDYT